MGAEPEVLKNKWGFTSCPLTTNTGVHVFGVGGYEFSFFFPSLLVQFLNIRCIVEAGVSDGHGVTDCCTQCPPCDSSGLLPPCHREGICAPGMGGGLCSCGGPCHSTGGR